VAIPLDKSVGLIPKSPPEEAWEPTCQAEAPPQKERVMPIPSKTSPRKSNAGFRSVCF